MSSTFKEWYKKNGKKLAERRKKRYEEDPEYRERRLREARRYYWLKKRRAEAIDARRIDPEKLEDLEPDRTITITITNEDDIRYGRDVMVPVFYPKSVAKLVNRSVQTIRLWSLKGILPEPAHRTAGDKRCYTKDEFKVIAENRHLLEYVTKNFAEGPFFVAIRDGWEKLKPDGIEVMHKDEWREDPTPCPWCYGSPSLQYKDPEAGEWTHVPCFQCADPVDVGKRLDALEREEVRVYCSACDVEEMQEIPPGVKRQIFVCSRCGRRAERMDG